MKKLLALVGVLVLVLAWWVYRRRNAPPVAPFAKVTRETVVSTLMTNGRMEPVEWTAVLAERSGVVEKLHAERGTRVARGDMLAEVGAENSKSDLVAAEARVALTPDGVRELHHLGHEVVVESSAGFFFLLDFLVVVSVWL